MRFKRKTEPKVGDQRTVYKFAWLPTTVGEYTVWLERYAIHQEYKKGMYVFGGNIDFKWVEVDRTVCNYYM